MKKLITLLIVISLCLQMMIIPTFAADNKDEVIQTYNAEIMNVKGGASAIATMTFDDGVHNTSMALYTLLKQYDLKASLMVVPERAETSQGSYSSVSQLREFSKDGYVDILSHSYTHLYMHDDGENAVNNTEENIAREVVDSYNYLRNKFPNQYPISMAVPGGNYSKDAEAAMMSTYYAARYKNSTASLTNIQSLTPAESIEGGGWYNLSNMWLKDSKIADGSLIAYLDACVQQGGWFFTGCHNFDPNGGNYDISVENLEVLMKALKAYQDSGDLWVATFSDATRYLREYESSTVKQYRTSEAMFVEVEMAERTPGGLPLTESIFNMPLTVKVVIPDGWENVRFRQNGVETIVKSFKRSGTTYAYVDVVPNSGRVSITNADEEIAKTPVKATLTKVKGGANAIASLTFDDGKVKTAYEVNELCKQYNCKASLMLITDRIDASNQAMWNQLFAEGYVAPESHSSNHEYLTPNPPSGVTPEEHAKNQTPENIADEITGSLHDLQRWFPNYDTLSFGIPYSSYSKEAYAELNKSFYSSRGGVCVLTYSGYQGKVQSLDPAIGYKAGDWYQLLGVRMMGEKANPSNPDLNGGAPVENYAVLTVENIVGYLNQCVKDGGWFVATAHGIVPGENLDITVEDLGQIMAVMQRLQDQNKLWVATLSEATKYIRERQNSKATAYMTFDGMYVEVTMDDMTEDGLPLTPDVFNMPLTVKVELPETWGRVVYSQAGGEEKTAYAFIENGVTYAYIDLVPNGGEAFVTNIGDPTKYVESLGMKQSVSAYESLTYNLFIPTDSYVTGVYYGATKLDGTKQADGYTRYSVGDIKLTSSAKEMTFRIKFNPDSGYVDYILKKSIISYMTDVIESEATVDIEKQLAYDFLVYAEHMLDRFSTEENAKLDAKEAVALAKEKGLTSTPPTGVSADLGTATNVLNGAAFAINEKPYYVFYVNEGFTGTLTFSYGEGDSKVETNYEIINGYYHCKKYVIYEVDTVYNLSENITITATGKIDNVAVSASGAYSLANFVEGLGGNAAPEYVKALYSYVLSAKSYQIAKAENSNG